MIITYKCNTKGTAFIHSLGFTTIYYSIKEPNIDSIKSLEIKVNKVDSAVNDLNDKIEQVRNDISKHDSTYLLHD